MNDLRVEEDEARRFFEVLGLTVTPVRTASTRTPDLEVDGDDPGYLVEVKRRTDSREFARALRRLGEGEQARPLGFEPNLFKALDDAHDQLQRWDTEHQRLWIVWLAIDVHAGPDIGLRTVVGTLYGVKEAILPADRGEGAISIECYYARPGAFERRTDLDAVIVSVADGFCACVNEFSSRAAAVLASRFVRRLAGRQAVVVPSEREALGNCFLADLEIDRRSEAAVVDDLRRRYRRHVVCLAEPLHHAAVARVRDTHTRRHGG